jgi:hypothetical protein
MRAIDQVGLIFWEEQSQDRGEPAVWRCSLEDPRSGKRRGFASLQALVTVLKQDMADSLPNGGKAQERSA